MEAIDEDEELSEALSLLPGFLQNYAPELFNEMMAAIPSNLSPRKRAARSLVKTGTILLTITILLTMLKAAKRRRLNDATHL